MNPSPQERPSTAQEQPDQDALLVDLIDDKPVLLDFEAGRLSSDAGLLLLGQIESIDLSIKGSDSPKPWPRSCATSEIPSAQGIR